MIDDARARRGACSGGAAVSLLPIVLATAALLAGAPAAHAQGDGAQRVDPVRFLLTVDDLPRGFSGTGPQSTAQGAAAMFMRAEALAGVDRSPARLLGVKLNLRVHDSLEEAVKDLRGELALNRAAIQADLENARLGGKVALVSVEPVQAALEPAEDAAAFHVLYMAEPLLLHDYRFRYRVGTVVIDLAVSGRALPDGGLPETLEAESLALAVRQAERVLALSSR